MGAGEWSTVGFMDCFYWQTQLAQIVDVGAPARGWILDWRAALFASATETFKRPAVAAFYDKTYLHAVRVLVGVGAVAPRVDWSHSGFVPFY